MAESVVSFVVERVGDLLISEAKFLYGVRDQVDQVRTELRRMQCFLKDADARQHESDTIKNLVEEIREIAYDVEDILLIFTFKVASSRRRRRSGRIRNILLRFSCILNEGTALHEIGSEIETIKNKISSLTTSLQTYGIRAITLGEGSSSAVYQRQLELRRSYSHVVQEDFVGLGGDVKTLVERLVNEDENWRVVSICGMGGLGKTTLAEKVYHHSDVRRHFDSFAWFCISQQWQKKDVLQGILIKLIPNEREQIEKMRDEELVKRLYDVQLLKKCLVVLDDIWSTDAWDSLRHAFPDRSEKGSKILLTSRNINIALYVDPHGFIHEPKCLSQEESWELLLKKAFPRMHGPDYNRIDIEMEKVGKAMVGRCDGLPLAIIVLGGILATKPYTSSEWEMVNQNLNWYLSKGKGQRGVSEVLGFSYHDLPYQFKQCFLYLGNFPEDKEIKARRLYQQWVAEGIVSSSEERGREETMMDVAERYLSELAQRCMVQVRVKKVWSSKTGGRFKSCRLHDLMRDLCLSKVKDENFLSIIDFGHGNVEQPVLEDSSSTRKIRRLAIYPPDGFGALPLPLGKEKAQAQAQAQHVRSLLFFNERSSLKLVQMITNFEDYKLLRVLNLEGFGENDIELAEAIGKLIHLRYLSLRYSAIYLLPSSIGNLGYLQTLDLRVSDIDSRIPNVLWKMEQLRHLYLPFYSNSKLRLDGLSNLETLTNFNTSNCDVKDLLKLTNLRKLKAIIDNKEQLGDFVTTMIPMKNRLRCSSLDLLFCSFCSEEELTLLRRVLGCHHLCKLKIYGGIRRALPEYHHFSPSLTKLELCRSKLEEDPMPTLEKLPSLTWLSLVDAFVGEEMVCSAMGFPQLTSLELAYLPNLEKWRVDGGAFPNLTYLQISNCDKLRMVPDGCRFITTLQQLVIRRMPESFENRLRVVDGEEGQDFYKVRHVPDIKFEPSYLD